MDQNWFYRGNALIHSLSEQETTSHSVAVWRIGQCGVFLKYNGKIILIDPVWSQFMEQMVFVVHILNHHFQQMLIFLWMLYFVHIIIWIIFSQTLYANWRLLIRM